MAATRSLAKNAIVVDVVATAVVISALALALVWAHWLLVQPLLKLTIIADSAAGLSAVVPAAMVGKLGDGTIVLKTATADL